MPVAQYRKKPVVIEAVVFDGTPQSATEVIDWVLAGNGTASYRDDIEPQFGVLAIRTMEGVMTANPSDYVIKGVAGEYYPCRADIFDKTYEPA